MKSPYIGAHVRVYIGPITREKFTHSSTFFGRRIIAPPNMFVTFVSARHPKNERLPLYFNENHVSSPEKFGQTVAWIFESYISCASCGLPTRDTNSTTKLNESLQIRRDDMKKDDEEHVKHNYKCVCTDCQMKFGSLPVLLEGIASKESKTEAEEECRPSTSRALPSTSRKEMSCSECGKTFTHRGDLNKHLRKHSGEKPFSCPMCEKHFSHTSNLTRHLKVHTGDKPFECDSCGKRFSRKDKLEQHKTSKICKKRSLLKTDGENKD